MIRPSYISGGLALSFLMSAYTVGRACHAPAKESDTISENAAHADFRAILSGTSRPANVEDCLRQARQEEALAFHPTYHQTEGLTEKASLQRHASLALAFYQRADELLAPAETAHRDRIRARQQILQASLTLLAH